MMKDKQYLQIGVGIIAILIIYMLWSNTGDNEYQVIESEIASSEITTSEIYVQVSGAVDSPGMYQMQSGQRINDLLIKASASNYNQTCINLAQKLVDEQNLYVPKTDEQCTQTEAINSAGIVNINTATIYELQTLNGIGESKATAIIEYREREGTFESKEQLLNVDGISEKLLQSIIEQISLS